MWVNNQPYMTAMLKVKQTKCGIFRKPEKPKKKKLAVAPLPEGETDLEPQPETSQETPQKKKKRNKNKFKQDVEDDVQDNKVSSSSEIKSKRVGKLLFLDDLLRLRPYLLFKSGGRWMAHQVRSIQSCTMLVNKLDCIHT